MPTGIGRGVAVNVVEGAGDKGELDVRAVRRCRRPTRSNGGCTCQRDPEMLLRALVDKGGRALQDVDE